MVLDQQSFLNQLVESGDDFILIVLDACRYDAMKSFVESKELAYEVKEASSKVPNTHTWVRTNWSGEYDITYISPIPFISDQEVDGPTGGGSYHGSKHFKKVVNAWRSHWSDEEGCVTPEGAVKAALDNVDDKMIIHFGQPHMPHIGDPPMRNKDIDSDNLAEVGETGEFTDEEIKESYMANLERAWKGGVEVLLRQLNLDNYSRVIITSDHGESLGEDGRYGHNTNTPEVHSVPWIEVK